MCTVACLARCTYASRTGVRVPAGGPGCVVTLRFILVGRQAPLSHTPTLHSHAPWSRPSLCRMSADLRVSHTCQPGWPGVTMVVAALVVHVRVSAAPPPPSRYPVTAKNRRPHGRVRWGMHSSPATQVARGQRHPPPHPATVRRQWPQGGRGQERAAATGAPLTNCPPPPSPRRPPASPGRAAA